jgi:glucokinase
MICINVHQGRIYTYGPFKKGDKVARRIVKTYLRYIAIGITNLGNILRPQVVVIGGGISNEGDWLINAVQDMVDKEIYGGIKINPRVIVKRGTLGNDAGIIGAASLAIYNLNK